ncbi:Hypothetical protein POVR2_LOCUS8 [uncultured virus]|nr:Hypothetical protein POVR2_LOCUS8 [uncultured virus]
MSLSSYLEDETILRLVAYVAPTIVLAKMLACGLWATMKVFVNNPHFWYVRIASRWKLDLQFYPADWKRVHWNLKLPQSKIATRFLDYDTMSITLQLGYDPGRKRATDLLHAVVNPDERVVKMFIARGWRGLTKDIVNRATADAIRLDNDRVVRELLSSYAQFYDSRCRNDLAIIAARDSTAEILSMLLARKSVEPSSWNAEQIERCMMYNSACAKLLIDDNRLSTSVLNSSLASACSVGNLETVEMLLAVTRIDPASNDNQAIISAGTSNSAEIVRLLLACKQVNPAARKQLAILTAVDSGSVAVVRALLADKRVNPSIKKSESFVRACSLGHLEVAKALVERRTCSSRVVHSGANNNMALKLAIRHKHSRVVEWLLTLYEVQMNPEHYQEAIDEAVKCNDPEIVDMLLQDSRVELHRVGLQRMYNIVHVLYHSVQDKLIGTIVLAARYDQATVQMQALYTQIANPQDTYDMLLQFIFLKRPIGEEVLDWMIEQHSKPMVLAARELDEHVTSYSCLLYTVCRSLLLLVARKRPVGEILSKVQAHSTQEHLTASATILGAYLGMRDALRA